MNIHLKSQGLIGSSVYVVKWKKETPFHLILHVPWVVVHVHFITRQTSPLLMRHRHHHDNFSVAAMPRLVWHDRSRGRTHWKHVCSGSAELYIIPYLPHWPLLTTTFLCVIVFCLFGCYLLLGIFLNDLSLSVVCGRRRAWKVDMMEE